MKLNCSRMESLISGEPCTKSSSLEVTVLAEGSFAGRIKRTGGRTKPLGCVNLLLVENMATASEHLAICHADEKFLPERGVSLVFPLLTGREFGNVNRHGNVLTVHSTKLVLTLESLGDVDVESDHSVATTAGKWSRILSRLVFAEPTGQESHGKVKMSGSGARSQGFGMGGLGISVPAQDALLATDPHSRLPQSASNSSMSRPRQLVPNALHSSSTKNLTDAPYSAPANLEQGNSLPKSQSFKRISLVLGGSDTDFGFGDDLKKILQTIDEPKSDQNSANIDCTNRRENPTPIDTSAIGTSSEELHRPNALTFLPPPVPFGDDMESDISITPSPNSLFLNPDAELSSVSIDSPANSSRRIDSILAKEQRQYAEKYGSRASAFNRPPVSFPAASVPTSETSSIKSNSRLPPQMPAPVVNDKIGDYTLSMDDLHDSVGGSAKTNNHLKDTSDELKLANGPSETKISPTRKAKTVQIAPEVCVINDSDNKSNTDSASMISVDMSMMLPGSRSFSNGHSSIKSTSTDDLSMKEVLHKEAKGSGPKFSKVMKKLLGKRKSKANLSAATTSEAYTVKHTSPEPANDTESTLNSPAKSLDTPTLPDVTAASDSHEGVDPPTPESMKVQSGGQKHLYLSLLEQETSPVSQDKSTSTSLKSLQAESEDAHIAENINGAKRNMTGYEDAPHYSKTVEQHPADVIATSSNNGCKTAAVPKLTNSTSALSFRSLSSRSLSARSLASSNSLDHLASFIHLGHEDQPADSSLTETLSDSPDNRLHVDSIEERQPPVTESAPKVAVPSNDKKSVSKAAAATRNEEASSPTLLRRESRQQLETVPISLDLDAYMKPSVSAARKMYESDNKSTSALPVKSASYSSFGSSRRSLNSYSSGSSVSSIGSSRNGVVTMFAAHMWGSIWNNNRWVPLSQLELPTEIVACNSASSARILVSGGASVNVDFNNDCEIRKVSHHDVEVRTSDATYMFRSRDADIAQRLYRLLWSIQSNGVQPVLSSLSMSNSLTGINAEILDENDAWACRRRTLMPPVLSKSNPNLNLSYMGRLTSTIIEE